MPALPHRFRAAEGRMWLLCRRFCDFRLSSGRRYAPGRIVAAPTPPHRHKYGRAVNPPVMKRLPESGLVPLVAGAFQAKACPDLIGVGIVSRQEDASECCPVPELPMFSVFVP